MLYQEICRRFVEHYLSLGFDQLVRAPLLHPSVPMSYIMSAGLPQVEVALKELKKQGDRFVLVQECFRHFDITKTGTDNTHLTLFHMPGAFVLGPPDKLKTVTDMWVLATQVLGLDRRKLWATYFCGDEIGNQQLSQDEITRQSWRSLGLPDSRIIGQGKLHNYWLQGPGLWSDGATPRKCGPNTELFFDRGEYLACGTNCFVGCGCGRFIEFANSLFVDRELTVNTNVLSRTNHAFSETVIGTERVAMILQNTETIYSAQPFQRILDTLGKSITLDVLQKDSTLVHTYVIADHLRALHVLIADGAPPPGKNGRERITKLLVRGVLTRQQVLGINSENFLPEISRVIADTFTNRVLSIPQYDGLMFFLESQYTAFRKTIERGQRELNKLLQRCAGRLPSGNELVYLEKSIGLPRILIAAQLEKMGIPFLDQEYQTAIQEWRQSAFAGE